MEDIIMTVAWQCDDKDCPAHWHKANYWLYDDGTYSVDWYSDGDHEDVDEADLPTNEEAIRSWRNYANDVALTGNDPLGEYMVRHSTKVRERWQFRFNKSIVGPIVIEARRAGRTIPRGELPGHVRRYLNLEAPSTRLADFADWRAFTKALPGVKPLRWTTIHIEHDRLRKAATVSRELRRLARRRL